ncbi:MAG TPA: hypothetical protein VFH08_02820 [Chitinophagaceae bacterium]|nr:hypothetical protein [Chitinophagaceae bacterium]
MKDVIRHSGFPKVNPETSRLAFGPVMMNLYKNSTDIFICVKQLLIYKIYVPPGGNTRSGLKNGNSRRVVIGEL